MASEGRAQGVITDESIAAIARKIERWESLAQEMQPVLTEAEIIEINNDFHYYIDKKIAYLRRWREKLGNRATYEFLITSVRICGKESLANSISELTGESGMHPVSDKDCPSADEPSSKIDEFNDLSDKFYAISHSLFRHLEDTHVHPRDVRTHLTVLDSRNLIKEASAIVDTVSNNLETKACTLTRLFAFLNSSVWNFIDYHLMEYVIKKFGNEDLKKRMAIYIHELEIFENHTTITQLIKVWDFTPKDCEYATCTVKIDKDPTCVTISDLNMLRKKICGEFWPRLSEYASYVLHNCKLKIGCFAVTWRFNSSLRSELEEKACKAHEFFQRNRVLSFSIGNEEVYVNKSKFTPETDSKKHVEEIVKDFMKLNPNCNYVNKEVIYHCYYEIKPYLDNNVLYPIMMSHDLVRNADDVERLTSSYIQPHDRHAALIQLAEKGGEYGFMLLYMCICATSEESPGHADAARILTDVAIQKRILPPYLRNTENRAEADSIDSTHRKAISITSDSSINSGSHTSKESVSEESGIGSATGMSTSGVPCSISVSSSLTAFEEDCPLADEPNSEMIRVNQDFTRINDKFYAISQSLFRHLEDTHVHPKDVRAHLTVLDSTILIKEASAIVDTVSDKLETKGTLARLFNFLNSSVWNFIDYHLMEYIIKKFGNEELKSRMTKYVCDLLIFENHTTITQLIEVWDKHDSVPKDCEDATVTMKIDKDPTRVTVSDLNTIRKKFCDEFWPHLSEYAGYVLHNCKLRIGCFVVTWRFNSGLRLELEGKACKAHEFFERNQVLSFSIGNEDVYMNKSKSKFTPEPSPFPLLKFPSDSGYQI